MCTVVGNSFVLIYKLLLLLVCHFRLVFDTQYLFLKIIKGIFCKIISPWENIQSLKKL